MNGKDVEFICNSFGMSHKDLAKSLNIPLFTVTRWINESCAPTGIHIEVLNGLHNILLKVKDKQKLYEIGIKLKLGIGAVIYLGLKDLYL